MSRPYNQIIESKQPQKFELMQYHCYLNVYCTNQLMPIFQFYSHLFPVRITICQFRRYWTGILLQIERSHNSCLFFNLIFFLNLRHSAAGSVFQGLSQSKLFLQGAFSIQQCTDTFSQPPGRRHVHSSRQSQHFQSPLRNVLSRKHQLIISLLYLCPVQLSHIYSHCGIIWRQAFLPPHNLCYYCKNVNSNSEMGRITGAFSFSII